MKPNLVSDPILPTLVRLSLPNMAAMLATALVALVETAFAGKIGLNALAGIAIVFPIVVLQQSLANGAIGGGVSSAISRALGRGDEEYAEALAFHSVILGLGIGLAVAIAMLTFGHSAWRLLGASGDVLDQAQAYALIAFIGAPGVWLTSLLISVFRGSGNMRLPSLVTLILLLAQAALGGAFGLGLGPFPQLGMSGVALGLTISYSGAALVLFACLQLPKARVRLRLRGIPLRQKLFRDILSVGLPTCISPIQTVLTVLIITALISRHGPEAMAGYGIGARLEMIMIPVAFGIGVACLPMVGMAIGVGNIARARRVAAIGAVMAGGFVGSIGVVVAIAAKHWAGLFASDPITASYAQTFLVIVGPAFAFLGVGLCLLFAAQGAGKVLGPVLAGTLRLAVVGFGGWYLVSVDAAPVVYFWLVAIGMVAYGGFAATSVWLSNWKPDDRRSPLGNSRA